MRFIFSSRFWLFLPIVEVLRLQNQGIGRVLLGMSSSTLPYILNATIRVYIGEGLNFYGLAKI